MSDKVLKPCPFCGCTLYHAVQNHYYQCKTNGCFLNTHFTSESEVDAYNTRNITESAQFLQSVIESLKKEDAKKLQSLIRAGDLRLYQNKTITGLAKALGEISKLNTCDIVAEVETLLRIKHKMGGIAEQALRETQKDV